MSFRWKWISISLFSPPTMIVLFVLAVSASVFGFVGWKAWDERETTLMRSADDNRNLSRSLAQHVSRTIGEVDLVLIGVAERLANFTGTPAEVARLNRLLAMRASRLSQVREMGVLDKAGRWAFASVSPLPTYSNIDRDYFQFHQNHTDPGLRVNEPIKGRASGRWTLLLTRRITEADGSFGGVVFAAIDLDYFQKFYQSFEIGDNGGIALFRNDGILLLRRPFSEDNVGRNFSSASFFRNYLNRDASGYYRAKSAFDGSVKRTAYEHLIEYPLVATVTLAEDEILAAWREGVRNDLLLAGAASTLIAIMGAFVAWQLRRRLATEATLRESEARYRLLADNSTDMVFQLDLAFTRQYVSPASKEILGYAPEELIATKPISQIHPDDADRVRATYQAVADGLDRTSVTNRIRHRDGRWIWVEAELRLVRDKDHGKPVGILGALRDVSRRMAMEAETIAARQQAEQAAAAQGQFLATMSHELRTPLNSVLGFADVLLDRKDLVPDVRRQVGLIQTAGAFLLTVVNDVLDFSKIEEGKLELAPSEFSLQSLIDNSVSIVRDFAAKKRLELTVQVDPTIPSYVLGDEGRLRQVVLNLLNNAIKFTQSGHVNLSIRNVGRGENGERIRFAVSDTGIGIPDDKIEHLFHRFSQVDGSTSREYGGTGLGLAICKRLVELMGGQIGVESRVGAGSTFWFTLALSAVARPNLAALPSPPRSSDIASARVLLVEDMVVNQEIARSMLESAGHHVDAVPDGLDAIMAVEARSYDVVLMDIQMPVMDGVTATRRIRGLPGPEKDVPIVAMTANVLPAQIESFRAAGMNGHVGKPIRREDLLKAVARFAPPASLAQVAPVRNSDSDAVLDADTFAEVTELLGHGKTNELLGRLRVQLTDQFPARAETTEELAKLAQEAHKFVSTAGMFGFQALSNSCARLEAAARGNHDDVADILAEAQAACRDTLAEIAVRLARPENAAKSA